MAASFLVRLSGADGETAKAIQSALTEALGDDLVRRPTAVILLCLSDHSARELASKANEIVRHVSPGVVKVVVYPLDHAPWCAYTFNGPALVDADYDNGGDELDDANDEP